MTYCYNVMICIKHEHKVVVISITKYILEHYTVYPILSVNQLLIFSRWRM